MTFVGENKLGVLLALRFWNDFVVFAGKLLEQSVKTVITLLIFVGLPDARVDNSITGSNFRRLCNATKVFCDTLLRQNGGQRSDWVLTTIKSTCSSEFYPENITVALKQKHNFFKNDPTLSMLSQIP